MSLTAGTLQRVYIYAVSVSNTVTLTPVAKAQATMARSRKSVRCLWAVFFPKLSPSQRCGRNPMARVDETECKQKKENAVKEQQSE